MRVNCFAEIKLLSIGIQADLPSGILVLLPRLICEKDHRKKYGVPHTIQR
jgi:hypothetical protein